MAYGLHCWFCQNGPIDEEYSRKVCINDNKFWAMICQAPQCNRYANEHDKIYGKVDEPKGD